MPIAITREVSPGINQCELTHMERQPIDYDAACLQHRQYEASLSQLGCEVHSLSAEPDLPDSVFVEDVAIVLDEVAIITRPGVESRRPERELIAEALKPYRQLLFVEAPATIDGGDVLRLGKTLYVGVSSRSNKAGIEQLGRLIGPYGYNVEGVPMDGCLHLKSAVTQVSGDTLLLNSNWADPAAFGAWNIIEVAPSEPMGANALMIGANAIYPSVYPATLKRLQKQGVQVTTVNVSELLKAEGAVTCCSLIFTA